MDQEPQSQVQNPAGEVKTDSLTSGQAAFLYRLVMHHEPSDLRELRGKTLDEALMWFYASEEYRLSDAFYKAVNQYFDKPA